MSLIERVIFPKPFNAHFHPRQEKMSELILPFTGEAFCGGVGMLNFTDPVVAPEEAIDEKKRILRYLPKGFMLHTPVMLTWNTGIETLERLLNHGMRQIKYIPGDTSTNSKQGVPLPKLLPFFYNHLRFMEKKRIIFSIHLELIKDKDGKTIPFSEREKAALPFAIQLMEEFPNLIIVFEHVSTLELARLVWRAPEHIFATVTPQHLKRTHDQVFTRGEITHQHDFCLPTPKFVQDQKMLKRIITFPRNYKFMCGTDSAAHPLQDKLTHPPKPGCFCEIAALGTYLEIFEEMNALHKEDALKNFFYFNAARLHNLPPHEKTVTMIREPYQIPKTIGKENLIIVPWRTGQTVNWRIEK